LISVMMMRRPFVGLERAEPVQLVRAAVELDVVGARHPQLELLLVDQRAHLRARVDERRQVPARLRVEDRLATATTT
jgi:hypothetical protein